MPSKVDITAAITGKMGWKIAHTIAGSPGQIFCSVPFSPYSLAQMEEREATQGSRLA